MKENSENNSSRWPWLMAILGLVIVNVVYLGFRTGVCLDAAEGSGATSTCTSGPLFGIEGTWLLGVISGAALLYFTIRFIRSTKADGVEGRPVNQSQSVQ